jgi:hypothetical protein
MLVYFALVLTLITPMKSGVTDPTASVKYQHVATVVLPAHYQSCATAIQTRATFQIAQATAIALAAALMLQTRPSAWPENV